jgi:pimeloyl-ACP methyl ester carboxylesterase
MSNTQTQITTNVVEAPSGRISYASAGSGPVALFVHGVVLNKHLWRHQLAELSDIRCCIAVDLLAHGDTEITPEQDVSVTANARMLKEVLDALHVDQIGQRQRRRHRADLRSALSQAGAHLDPYELRCS